MAIIFESFVFSLVAVFMMNKMAKNTFIGIGAGALVGLISATAWVYFAIYAMNAHLLGRVITTAEAFITNQGVAQAAFAGVLLPFGYLAGDKLAARTYPVLTRRPLYYAISVVTICLCWGISAIAKIAGL